MDISNLRQNYKYGQLNETDADPNPFVQFINWMRDAKDAGIIEPNACTLSTVSLNGGVSSRIILLKEVRQDTRDGLRFFTNYHSTKGQELSANPHASLCFFWDKLERQININGLVTKISTKESEAYFHSRPRESQLGAWASHQSEVLPNGRLELEERYQLLEKQYDNQPIPIPPHWGGYCLVPSSFHFWQGRTSRLHDRLLYTKSNQQTTDESANHNAAWHIVRLSP